MQNRIFKSIFITAFLAVLIVGAFTAHTFYGIFDTNSSEQLRTDVEAIAEALSRVPNDTEYLSSLPENRRITLIDASGTVLYDNGADSGRLENHAGRPEVVSALKDGRGSSTRYSDTLTEKTHYFALRLADGRVLRVAITHSSIVGMFHRVLMPLIAVITLTAVMAFIFSRKLARSITAPLQEIDLADPLKSDAYDELSPILCRLQDQNDELRLQLEQLTRQRNELDAITDNMREGLLMLDRDGTIISLNKSAARIFSADADKMPGKNILTLNRSAELSSVVHASQRGENGEAILELGGRSYQLLSTPVANARASGSVILALDATARLQAEKERREFSANVSHELRTPLTTIIGYSEIMSNGLAKPEDMKPFAEKIHSEAQRLMQLINDIIQLSRLDEKTKLPEIEDVPLRPLCENIVSRLSPAAKAANISLSLSGDSPTVAGNTRLIDEMISNLVDNAIKYNKTDGSVLISLTAGADGTTVTVKDTGVGIPDEHQERIFERFYRVDKSHSRETGGTGLGLAIVKHSAAILGAKIRLTSTPGQGSEFSIIFPNR